MRYARPASGFLGDHHVLGVGPGPGGCSRRTPHEIGDPRQTPHMRASRRQPKDERVTASHRRGCRGRETCGGKGGSVRRPWRAVLATAVVDLLECDQPATHRQYASQLADDMGKPLGVRRGEEENTDPDHQVEAARSSGRRSPVSWSKLAQGTPPWPARSSRSPYPPMNARASAHEPGGQPSVAATESSTRMSVTDPMTLSSASLCSLSIRAFLFPIASDGSITAARPPSWAIRAQPTRLRRLERSCILWQGTTSGGRRSR
jgi:hypothetical protein